MPQPRPPADPPAFHVSRHPFVRLRPDATDLPLARGVLGVIARTERELAVGGRRAASASNATPARFRSLGSTGHRQCCRARWTRKLASSPPSSARPLTSRDPDAFRTGEHDQTGRGQPRRSVDLLVVSGVDGAMNFVWISGESWFQRRSQHDRTADHRKKERRDATESCNMEVLGIEPGPIHRFRRGSPHLPACPPTKGVEVETVSRPS